MQLELHAKYVSRTPSTSRAAERGHVGPRVQWGGVKCPAERRSSGDSHNRASTQTRASSTLYYMVLGLPPTVLNTMVLGLGAVLKRKLHDQPFNIPSG